MVAEADRLVANTDDERDVLIGSYGADPGRIDVVAPGVDTGPFHAGAAARRPAGRSASTPPSACWSSPAGSSRSKVRTCCCGRRRVLGVRFSEERFRVLVVGGLSGSGSPGGHRLAAGRRAGRLGRRWSRSCRRSPREELAQGVPGRRRGRRPELQRVVRAGRAGGPGVRNAGGRRRRRWTAGGGPGRRHRCPGGRPRPRRTGRGSLAAIALDRPRRDHISGAARVHAEKFSWDSTVDGLLASYERAIEQVRR